MHNELQSRDCSGVVFNYRVIYCMVKHNDLNRTQQNEKDLKQFSLVFIFPHFCLLLFTCCYLPKFGQISCHDFFLPSVKHELFSCKVYITIFSLTVLSLYLPTVLQERNFGVNPNWPVILATPWTWAPSTFVQEKWSWVNWTKTDSAYAMSKVVRTG